MLTNQQVNYTVNITLHVFILFVFLCIFFFAYISKLTEDSVSDALNDMIKEQTGNILDVVNDWDEQLNPDNSNINWDGVNKLAQDIQENSQGKDPEIEENNKKLKKLAIIMVLLLFFILIGMIVIFKYLGYNLHLKEILIENIVIFTFVGLIEYLFFTQIASKYIPVTPDVAGITILQRINNNILDKVTE
jgi:hypothetical protein